MAVRIIYKKQNTEFRRQNFEGVDLRFTIFYLRLSIDYFSMARKTLLISMNPCQTDSVLKKQSQFDGEQNDVRAYMKGYYGIITLVGARKNKAKQSQYAGRWPEIRNTKL